MSYVPGGQVYTRKSWWRAKISALLSWLVNAPRMLCYGRSPLFMFNYAIQMVLNILLHDQIAVKKVYYVVQKLHVHVPNLSLLIQMLSSVSMHDPNAIVHFVTWSKCCLLFVLLLTCVCLCSDRVFGYEQCLQRRSDHKMCSSVVHKDAKVC